ncbi:MAG: gatC [Chlamydiales bacterium]|jgi:aspartyl-tRNA(Asn)/glutamyl-tRNA(Gln) amidotransferase subunit C|nr:gatC [Chlamydiales bacterium]
MSKLERQDLIDLTKLCRIQCSEEEIDRLLLDVQNILNYVDQLQEIDTTGVPPCNHVLEGMVTFTRKDAVAPQEQLLDRVKFLENSPSSTAGMVRVEKVL